MDLRIGRPVSDLKRSAAIYCKGLGLAELGRFENHDGFDGVMLGRPGWKWHFEFTYCRPHPVVPTPTPEDLVVLYVPDRGEWGRNCAAMLEAGFDDVAPYNPYWGIAGRTFQDPDGYRFVLQQGGWGESEGG